MVELAKKVKIHFEVEAIQLAKTSSMRIYHQTATFKSYSLIFCKSSDDLMELPSY